MIEHPEEKNLQELERLMALAASGDRVSQAEYGRRALEAVPHLIAWLREAWAREDEQRRADNAPGSVRA